MSIKDDRIFDSHPDLSGDEDYFVSAFPNMPDVNKLGYHSQAVAFMTKFGIEYYLDFFLSYLEANPHDDSMLFDYLDGALNHGIGNHGEFPPQALKRFAEVEKIRLPHR